MNKISKKLDEKLYRVTWKEEIIPLNFNKCDHFFEIIGGGKAECVHCHLGLLGVYACQDGRPLV